MRKPLFVRPLSEEERLKVEAGLRSSSAFTLRRSQIILASARGEHASAIARSLSINTDTVINGIHAFNARGVAALVRRSSRAKTLHFVLPPAREEALKAVLHESPRTFGKERSRWTLALLAEVAFEEGLSSHTLTEEGMRKALLRFGIRWQRAKEWIESPDPAYARKKVRGTDC